MHAVVVNVTITTQGSRPRSPDASAITAAVVPCQTHAARRILWPCPRAGEVSAGPVDGVGQSLGSHAPTNDLTAAHRLPQG